MIKKRLRTILPAMVLSVVTGISFVACGGNGGTSDNGGTGGNGGNGGGTGGGAGGGSVAVTEEQWNNAFDVSNFLKDAKIVYNQSAQSHVQESTLLLSGEQCGSYSVTDTYTDGEDTSKQTLIVIVGGEVNDDMYIKSDDDDWAYNMIDRYDYAADNYAYWKESVLNNINYEYLTELAKHYSSFTYKSGKLTYSGAGIVIDYSKQVDEDYVAESTVTAKTVTVTIADNKLSSIEMTCKYKATEKCPSENIDESVEMDFNISYSFVYAPQTVEAPEGVKPQA